MQQRPEAPHESGTFSQCDQPIPGRESQERPLCVTQIRLRGMVFSTRVHAERQGPSMITRWPDFRSWDKKVIYGPTTPPELEMMRTSAEIGPIRASDKAT